MQQTDNTTTSKNTDTITNVASVSSGDGAGAMPASVQVAPGDSLWSIANRIYGNSDMYLQLYRANRDHIRNPDLIFPGMTLSIPAATDQLRLGYAVRSAR